MLKIPAKVLTMCAIFITGIFFLHTLYPSLISGPHPSSKLVDNNFLQSIWQLHTTNPAFAGRPLTNLSIGVLHNYFSIPIGWSFVIVNFSLLFFCGLLIYAIALAHKRTHKQALFSTLLFYTSLTILFAFFRSIDTYDDPWQYFLVLSSILLILKNKWCLSLPIIFLACLARETTIFLLPGFILLTTNSPLSLTNLKSQILNLKFLYRLSLITLPVLAYFLIEPMILNHNHLLAAAKLYAAQSRFTHWQFNFQNTQFAIETITSLLLVLLPPTLFTYLCKIKTKLEPLDAKYLHAFLITLLINTPIVLIASRAREARLFALPLLFLWPLLGKYFEDLLLTLRNSLKQKPRHILRTTCYVLPATFIAAWFSFFVFKPTFAAGFDLGFQIYCFFIMTIVAGYTILTTRYLIPTT